jgi:hypothetical protein
LELGKTELHGAHKLRGAPLELVALSYLFWPPPEASRVPSCPEKINLKIFFSVWTLFDIDFLKSQKQELALGMGLIG